MNTTTSFLAAITWRFLIALSTRTFFQPDEFFQSLEVAHRAVFGYGHLTWEWTASPPIRSVFFPALYMPVYWILKVTGCDNGQLLIVAPKLFQGIIASITDVSTRELARSLLGGRYADTAFVLSLTSFFHLLALGRTFSNSVETSFTAAALCFWPWHSVQSFRRLQLAFALAAGSCLVRPTSIIIWAFLFIELVWRVRLYRDVLRRILIMCFITAFFAAGCLLCMDIRYFGEITFTPLNFVRTNLSSVSLFYGQAPWHYYFSQALPILLNVCLPSFVFGARNVLMRGLRHQRVVLALITWAVFVYSLLGHKEWRFLHPMLPLMLVVSAKSLVDSEARSEGKTESSSEKSDPRHSKKKSLNLKMTVICVLGILPGIYVMRYHGRAQISVMSHLRSLISTELHSVGFLMPCHSTPWQAYLHRPELSTPGHMWALSCEPPLYGLNLTTYKDQTDVFYASPLAYLKQNFPESVDSSFPPSPYPSTSPGSAAPPNNKWDHAWPSHLVFFAALIQDEDEKGDREREGVGRYLREMGYREVWRAGNGFEEDWRRRGGVRVWQWRGSEVDM